MSPPARPEGPRPSRSLAGCPASQRGLEDSMSFSIPSLCLTRALEGGQVGAPSRSRDGRREVMEIGPRQPVSVSLEAHGRSPAGLLPQVRPLRGRPSPDRPAAGRTPSTGARTPPTAIPRPARRSDKSSGPHASPDGESVVDGGPMGQEPGTRGAGSTVRRGSTASERRADDVGAASRKDSNSEANADQRHRRRRESDRGGGGRGSPRTPRGNRQSRGVPRQHLQGTCRQHRAEHRRRIRQLRRPLERVPARFRRPARIRPGRILPRGHHRGSRPGLR